jgi:mannobiose 2-epimerase
MGVPVGFKSANTHLHLLEAFAELYRARPDAEHRSRLEELTHVVGDVMRSEEGAIATWFSRDWRPTHHAESYGHSLEAAWLLLDAAALLASDPGKARGIADRALERGYDSRHGGVYSEGMPGEPASRQEKVWWVQAEALNCLAVLHELFGHQTPLYRARLLETWEFIRAHVLDHRYRGWFGVVSRSGRSVRDARKGHRWKAAYHDVRSLLEVSERVRRMSATGAL